MTDPKMSTLGIKGECLGAYDRRMDKQKCAGELRCRYDDCEYPVAEDDDVQITCPKCREDLGLPELAND